MCSSGKQSLLHLKVSKISVYKIFYANNSFKMCFYLKGSVSSNKAIYYDFKYYIQECPEEDSLFKVGYISF